MVDYRKVKAAGALHAKKKRGGNIANIPKSEIVK